MRILHVVQGYTPAIGGTEHLIQKLSEQLVSRYEDDVTVFTTTVAKNCSAFWLRGEPMLPAGTEIINGVTVRRFPIFNRLGMIRHRFAKLAHASKMPFNDWARAMFNGPIVFNMSQEIAKFKADVILASSFPFLHMHYALAGGRRSQTPVILHGALHTTDRWSFDRPMIDKAITQADAYIANSKFEQEYVLKRGQAAAKTTTIGVGVNLESFAKAQGHPIRAKYGWENSSVIGFVGHLANRKGVPLLLEAMRKVWTQLPQAKLLLAGSTTPFFSQLEKSIEKIPPQFLKNIAIEADFSEADKAELFAACDVIVLPSKEESFGIVFLEAWACHKPVIGLRVGAIPSIIAEGTDGLLAKPDDEQDLAHVICQLVTNPTLGHKLGESGYRKVCENYTWEIVTDKFRRIYQKVQE